MRFTTSLVALLALTACGGGGGDSTPGPGPFTSIVLEHRDLERRAGPAPTQVSELTERPTSDIVAYNGFIVFDTEPEIFEGNNPPGVVIYSRIGLEMNFSENTLSTPNPDSQQFWRYDEIAGGPVADEVSGRVVVSSTEVGFNPPDTSCGQECVDSFPLIITGSLAVDGVNTEEIIGRSLEGTFAGDPISDASCFDGTCAGDIQYFGAIGTTTFEDSGTIPTRIVAEF